MFQGFFYVYLGLKGIILRDEQDFSRLGRGDIMKVEIWEGLI